MATHEERAALLAVSCRWCSAKPGEECHAVTTGRAARTQRRHDVRRPLTTLDAGCHDARWQDALGRAAPVLPAMVEARQEPTQRPSGATLTEPRPW